MKSSKKGKASTAGSNLMALGSAAVLAVYAAGYLRTKPAADLLAAQSSMRRPLPTSAGAQGAPARPAPTPSLDAAISITAGDSGAAAVIAAAKTTEASALPAATASMQAVPGTGSTTVPTDPTAVASSVPAVVRDSVSVIVPPPAATKASAPVPSMPAPSVPAVAASAVVATPAPAPASLAAPAVAPAPAATAAAAGAKAGYKNGLFFGRGTSRHGDIESMIEISNGRIISAVISQCLTQYTCRWIAALPGQVLARQSADVDYVTGATESANAFYFSIVQALMQAK